jgi:prophage antirepressor-like protein
VSDGDTIYKFDGLEIRTVEDGNGKLWLNYNDVLMALNMEPPDLSGTDMIDEVDAFRVAKLCQDQDKFERFVVWLVEEVGVGPYGFRSAFPIDDSDVSVN